MKTAVTILLLLFANQSVAECMATGYRKGSKVPSFWLMSKESLGESWNTYVERKEKPFIKEYGDPEDINQICLVNTARELSKNMIDFENAKKIVIEKSCSDLEVGSKHRLFISHYCIEFTDNFYMSLPYKFGTITRKRKY